MPVKEKARNASHKKSNAMAWLDRSVGLLEANAEVGREFSVSDLALPGEAHKYLQNEIGFIDSADFHKPRCGASIFKQPLNLERDVANGKSSLPVHFDRLCEAALLKPEQERMLFERMNFLLCKAFQLRATIDPDAPVKQTITNIKRLLALANWHRDRIIEANLRLVFSIVKKFVNPYVTFDDLLGDGMLALIRAVEKFDYSRGFRFSTYATQVVRRNSYRLVVDKQTERSRVMEGLDELGIEIPEVSRESSMTEQRWHLLRLRLSQLLDQLDKREKLIIRARFSLGSHRRVQTLQSIANRLGVSKERVRQIEKRALEKLHELAGTVELAEM